MVMAMTRINIEEMTEGTTIETTLEQTKITIMHAMTIGQTLERTITTLVRIATQ